MDVVSSLVYQLFTTLCAIVDRTSKPVASITTLFDVQPPHTRGARPSHCTNIRTTSYDMSEPIPESVPTSADPRSRRPLKRARVPNTAISAQSQALEVLFERQPDIQIPTSTTIAPRSASSLAPPPEIVTNVQGSSAGAGSGEFHVYKASRRREYERIRLMEDESKREEADKQWAEKVEESKKKDEEKRSKNAKKRAKAKDRKGKKENSGVDGMANGNGTTESGVNLAAGRPKDLSTDAANGTYEGTPVAEEGGIVIHDED